MEFESSYSWLVMAAIAVNSMTALGLTFGTSGVLAAHFPKLLKIDVTYTNWIGSTLIGTFLLTVPFAAKARKSFGYRVTSAASSVFMILGIFIAAFSTNLWHLIAGYAALTGLGIAGNLMSMIGIIPHYFKKWQNVAYSVVGVGNGIAMLCYPFLTKNLLEMVGYRYTILCISPLTFLTLTAPLFFVEQLPRENKTATLQSLLGALRHTAVPIHYLNSFFWNSGHIALVILLYGFVQQSTGSTEIATKSQTIFGGGNAAGGLLLMLILLKIKINHYILQLSCNVLSGIVAILIARTTTTTDDTTAWVLYTCVGMLGAFYTITIGNMACLCAHLYPSNDIEYAYGYQSIFGGIGSFVGPLTANLLQKEYGLSSGIYYSGGLLLTGGIVLIIPALVKVELLKVVTLNQTLNNKSEQEMFVKEHVAKKPLQEVDDINCNSALIA